MSHYSCNILHANHVIPSAIRCTANLIDQTNKKLLTMPTINNQNHRI